MSEPLRFGYADPPYIGCCSRYGHFHPDNLCWDDPDTTRALIVRLSKMYDGWALSCKSDPLELAQLVAWAKEATDAPLRLAAWVKPFAVFKPNVNPAYAWEPVLVAGSRAKRDRAEPTVRDFHSENITLKKGLTGAKPPGFNRWVIDLLGVRPGIDTLHDIFPGTGGMEKAMLASGVITEAVNLQPPEVGKPVRLPRPCNGCGAGIQAQMCPGCGLHGDGQQHLFTVCIPCGRHESKCVCPRNVKRES